MSERGGLELKTPRNPQDRRKYVRHQESCLAMPGVADFDGGRPYIISF